jgi:hypothetical protein
MRTLNTKKEICIICKSEFMKRIKRGGKTKTIIRGMNTITCSPRCSRKHYCNKQRRTLR